MPRRKNQLLAAGISLVLVFITMGMQNGALAQTFATLVPSPTPTPRPSYPSTHLFTIEGMVQEPPTSSPSPKILVLVEKTDIPNLPVREMAWIIIQDPVIWGYKRGTKIDLRCKMLVTPPVDIPIVGTAQQIARLLSNCWPNQFKGN